MTEITHYDLFAGIGGFSLALEEVFNDATIKHIFCEWEQFPTAVLKQHWPDGEYYGDIADLVAHTGRTGLEKTRPSQSAAGGRGSDTSVADPLHRRLERGSQQTPRYPYVSSGKRSDETSDGFTIVTGGFPCQPFSHAGRRQGTADDRYQWPNMFEVICNTRPEWVIAENVRGLVTWNDGLVLETVCTDLEAQGYEVQPFIIPAVAVGAPHRRDRVWIIGRNPQYAEHAGLDGAENAQGTAQGNDRDTARQDELKQLTGSDSLWERDADTPHTDSDSIPVIGRTGYRDIHATDAGAPGTDEDSSQGGSGESRVGQKHEPYGNGGSPDADTGRQRWQSGSSKSVRPTRQESERPNRQYPDWERNWQEVAFTTCDDSVDDGLSRLVDGVPVSRARWRKDSLKAYGNGIVPEVAMQIMKAIKDSL